MAASRLFWRFHDRGQKETLQWGVPGKYYGEYPENIQGRRDFRPTKMTGGWTYRSRASSQKVHAAWYHRFFITQLDHDGLQLTICRVSLQLAGCHSTKAYR